MTNRQDIEWYRKEHLRIVDHILDEVRNDPTLKAMIMRPADDSDPATRHREPADWEEWLKDANKDTFFTLKRLRFQANEIWASGSADPVMREKFTVAVETEYKLSIWAAGQYVKAVRSLELGALHPASTSAEPRVQGVRSEKQNPAEGDIHYEHVSIGYRTPNS